VIRVPDAELASACVLGLFAPPEDLPEPGVHETAWVHPEADVHETVRIGAHVSIAQGCSIAADIVLHAGVRRYADVSIGEGTTLHANVVVRQGCIIGRGVIIHQTTSIGADGFGYRAAPDGSGLVKMPHIGTVRIEEGVEIGANSCVDRGKFGATVIGAGTKIDNFVQIAHNCQIGRCCIIAGGSGLAGSVVLEDGVLLGAGVGIIDHLRVGAGARIGAGSRVLRDIPPGEAWFGFPAGPAREIMRQMATIRKLPELVRRISSSAARAASDEEPATSD